MKLNVKVLIEVKFFLKEKNEERELVVLAKSKWFLNDDCGSVFLKIG